MGPGLAVPAILVAVALALRFVPGWVAPFSLIHFIGLGAGPLLGVLGLIVWWLATRTVPRRDRWLGLAFALAGLAVGFALSHRSMTQVLVLYGLILLQVVFVAGLAISRAVPWNRRRKILALGLAVAWLPWALLRQDGQVGELTPELALRWTPTAEDLYLAARADSTGGVPAGGGPVGDSTDWPGYRGPGRDGRVEGVAFTTDWAARPPRELWRRRVGAGWSSFASAGDRVFTQEQRGEEEVVAAYGLRDGRELWARGYPERFEEPASGAGPRATPTFDGGTVFALGARGILQALDAASGERLWQRDLTADLDASVPTWGFSSSPLVAGRAVLVFAGAQGRAVAAYERSTGELLWASGSGSLSYGSVHLARLGESLQVLMATDLGLEAFDPEDGRTLWQYRRPLTQMARIVQPIVLEDGESLIFATGYGEGTRRLRVRRAASGDWTVEEVWSSRFLKPYFNGLVCHRDTCFGFDGKIFTAIGADDGERRWKGGRYGHGQVVLLADMDLLLVVTEKGEVVLVEATAESHREIARLPALEGKTWNHPVITGGKLLVRNAAEAACFELPV